MDDPGKEFGADDGHTQIWEKVLVDYDCITKQSLSGVYSGYHEQ